MSLKFTCEPTRHEDCGEECVDIAQGMEKRGRGGGEKGRMCVCSTGRKKRGGEKHANTKGERKGDTTDAKSVTRRENKLIGLFASRMQSTARIKFTDAYGMCAAPK